MGSVLEEIKEDAIKGAESNKSKTVVKNLSKAFSSVGACDEFYDLVGNVVKINASLFMDCYGDLEGKLKKITPGQLVEMDKNIFLWNLKPKRRISGWWEDIPHRLSFNCYRAKS